MHQGQNYTPIVDTFFDMLVSIDRDPSGPPLSRGTRFKASTYQHGKLPALHSPESLRDANLASSVMYSST